MSEWKKVKLEEVCKIKSGKRLPKGHDFSSMPTEYKYIRARDIKNGIINGYNLVYITKDTHEKISQYIVDTNDIVITIVGASVGDVAYVTSQFQGMNLTENAVRLTDFSSYVDSKYAFYVLNSSEYYDIMQRIAGGAAQPKLGIYKIEAIELSLPPLSIQHRIATILSRYDALIENYQKQIKLLEEAAQRLYREWFVDLRFPGHENTKLVDGVPEGWEKKKVGELANISAGGDKPEFVTEEKTTYCKVPIYSNGTSKGGLYGYTNKSSNTAGSITVSARGSIGFACLRMHDYFSIVRLISIKPYKSEDLMYLFQFAKVHTFMSNGAAQQQLTVPMVKAIDIVYPAGSLLKAFESAVLPLYKQTESLQSQLRLLTEARDRLLPKLMSGEITV